MADYCEGLAEQHGSFGALMQHFHAGYDAAARTQVRVLREMRHKLFRTAEAVEATRETYLTAERDVAVAMARIEQQLGGVHDSTSPGTMPQPAWIGGYEDQVAVDGVLIAPRSHDDRMNRQIEQIGGTLGTIDDIWRWCFGESLLDQVFTPISGDWGRLRSIADGWDNLGTAAKGVEDNLTAFKVRLGQTWQGPAAARFDSYLNQWRNALSNERVMTADLAAFVRDIAENAEAAFVMIATTLNLVVDIVLTARKISAVPGYNQLKAITKLKEAASAAEKIFEVLKALFDLVESFTAYVDALVKAIDEGNDNAPAPSGAVAVPHAV
ncbi:hypothetical protein A6A25_20590 [Saccharothrix sp. CB00851]|nr:hypothetical protein A6A25_20590 [Saccharothrix sp. CB00851]